MILETNKNCHLKLRYKRPLFVLDIFVIVVLINFLEKKKFPKQLNDVTLEGTTRVKSISLCVCLSVHTQCFVGPDLHGK